jgi:hypothetical protein
MPDHQTNFPRNPLAAHAPVTHARPDSPRAVCPDRITQAELEELRDVKREYRQLKRRLAQLRVNTLTRLELGATVEHGPLTARVKRVAYRFVNARTLLRPLGPVEVARLKALVEPKILPRLLLKER